MADHPTFYDITIDETRPVTQADVDSMGNIYSAFGMWREAEKALMALTLSVGQGKTTQEEAWRRLAPLMDGWRHDRPPSLGDLADGFLRELDRRGGG